MYLESLENIQTQKKRCPLISVVSPVYRSEELVDELINRLMIALSSISEQFEIILVDDGSPDRSWEKIEKRCKNEKRIQGVRLSRNFGQHFAISAGIDRSKGEWVVVMDCDLQDRPEEIPNLYEAATLGNYDMVLAKRANRQDGFIKCYSSKLFYRVLSFLSGTQYDNTIGNFGIYHKKAIRAVLQMQEKIRYFPAMINWIGFKKSSIEVQHSQRPSGKTSYNLKKQLKLAIDILLAYSDKPLRLIIALGLSFSFLSFVLGFSILLLYLSGKIHVVGYASIVASLCFFSGVIISVLGVIGLYVGKIFDGIKNRPTYLIRDVINE
ncbi:MAG: glycosyltransferase family 2 protein [Parachlamydiales bacterium]|nr:glycosyltransferase family 2 protein [Parachlamydiales bacterium]